MSVAGSLSRLLRSVRKSRDQWKDKAQERHEQIRALQIRVRDLERSRAKWKERAQGQRGSKEAEALPEAEEAGEGERLAAGGDDQQVREGQWLPKEPSPSESEQCLASSCVRGHSYPLGLVHVMLRLLLDSYQSLRGSVTTLSLFRSWLGWELPHYTTVSQWSYRLGLYLLSQPKVVREDWIWIVDQTLESGPQGCLVVAAVARSALPTVGFSPRHQDLQVLEMAVLKHATGVAVAARLEALSKRVGVPCQIVADHGSDVKKGIELFQQAHPETIYTYDISHALANLLKHELRSDARWTQFLKQAHQSRQQVKQTELAFLAAPRQRSKARMMASERHVYWAEQLLAYHDRGDFRTLDPRYSVDWSTYRAFLALWGAAGLVTLVRLFGRVFADESAFRQALIEYQGEAAVASVPTEVWSLASYGGRRFGEKFAWLLDYRQELPVYRAMIERIRQTQIQLKQHGLRPHSYTTLRQTFRELPPAPDRVRTFQQRILDTVAHETRQLPPQQTLLASSDCLESLFGTYKAHSERGPIQEIGKRILLIPALVTQITLEQVRNALETVRNADVEQWVRQVCGPSMLAQRIGAFRTPKKGLKTA